MSNFQGSAQNTKWKIEYEEAVARKKVADATQDPATIIASTNEALVVSDKRIEHLKMVADEYGKRHKELEGREEALRKSSGAAATVPGTDAEVIQSLNEQLRVAKAAQSQAEQTKNKAENDLNIAQLRLSLIGESDKNCQELEQQYDKMVLQLEQCHSHREEMRREILRLRDELKKVEKQPSIESTELDDGDELFIRQEARALHKFFDNYIKHSQQYQKIIDRLEQKVIDLMLISDSSKLSTEDAEHLTQKKLGLNVLKEQKVCEREKRRLQEQLDALKDHAETIKALRKKIMDLETKLVAHPTLESKQRENNALRKEIEHMNDKITNLKREIAEAEEIARADPDRRAGRALVQLSEVKKQLERALNERNAIRNDHDRHAKENNDYKALASQIIQDIAGTEGLQNEPHPDLASAVTYLRDQCNIFRLDARQERRALDRHISQVTPAIDALKAQKGQADDDLVDCQKHVADIQKEIENQDKIIKQMQTSLREHTSDRLKNEKDLKILKGELEEAEKALKKRHEGKDDGTPSSPGNKLSLEQLKQQKEDAEVKVARYVKHGQNLEDQIQALERKLANANKNLERSKQHVQDSENQIEDLQSKLIKIKETLEKCLGGQQVIEKGPESSGNKQLLRRLKLDRRRHVERINDLEAEVEEAEQQVRKLSAQINKMKRDLDDTTQKLADCEAGRNRAPPRKATPRRKATPVPDPGTPPTSPPPAPVPPRVISPSPSVSEDTAPHTPGGTKRKARPGARLRRETRANKRREIEMHKNSFIKDPHEPCSPPHSD